ncbi:hypothetical protein [Streptomyces sp. NBC_01803]|uniref:hypothetical protein n=1 Tax=Streptomyces sp. NBC_01803 TaxID=2975946 RepID=UPI002DDC693C|nr:hypothetical protein [Streptomyces sp. NBC_01803]WSA44319.1 hypothetical protein OIE51_08935 [Streptomyces sp. NBC_01803]
MSEAIGHARNGESQLPIPAAEFRHLLTAVFEALDIPAPATVGDGEVHDRLLVDRVIHARIALASVLNEGDDPGWSADYLRARLAELPATGYRAYGQSSADTNGGRS